MCFRSFTGLSGKREGSADSIPMVDITLLICILMSEVNQYGSSNTCGIK